MYQNPSILLSEINEYANRLCTLGGSSESATELRNALRVTNIQQAIGSAPVIAIAGLQGAGKSTLAAEILRIPEGDNWFPMNIGRGENLPLLVTQKEGISAPRAYAHRFAANDGILEKSTGLVSEEILDREKFKARAMLPEPEDIFLELELPLRNCVGLPASLRLLVLPGFEQPQEQWELFTERQLVTKEAMSASMFTLLVMNPSQSALRSQWDLFNEYLREFRDALPLIVLSCADQDNNGNEALRRKLLEDPELLLSSDQVLTRGNYEGSSEIAKNQRDALVSAIHERWASSHSSRSVQIERMKKAIRRVHVAAKELADDLEEPIDEYLEARNIEKLMAPYLEGERKLTKSFHEHLNDRLERAYESAVEAMMKEFSDQSGWDRFCKSVGDWFKGGPEPLEFVDCAKRHWENQFNGKKAFLDIQKRAVGDQLFIQNATDWDGLHAGYGHDSTIPDEKTCDPNVMRWIVCPKNKLSPSAFVNATSAGQRFTESLRLLPVYAFENQRLLASVQAAFKENDHSEISKVTAELYETFVRSGGLERGDNKHLSSILQFGAMVLGADFAGDGHFDILKDLFGSLGGGTVATTSAGASAASCIAAGVVAVASAGVLYGKVMHNAWKYHHQQREAVTNAIRLIQQNHAKQLSKAFSRFIDLMREATHSRMRLLLGLDEKSDARFYRIALKEALDSRMRQLEYAGHFRLPEVTRQ
jgi:hypothetical protein